MLAKFEKLCQIIFQAAFTNYFPVKTVQPRQGDPSTSNAVSSKQANVSLLKQANRSTEVRDRQVF